MRIVGIDPGKTGAIAVVNERICAVVDTPVFGTRSRPGDLNPDGMISVLRSMEPHHVYIETQQAMPKQGVSSTFQTGYGYGLWVGIITTLGLPWTAVRASAWKKTMLAGLDKTDKSVSRIAAARLFPQVAADLSRVSDHGRAEALLIAAYGQKECKG